MLRIDQRLAQKLNAAKSSHVGVWGTLSVPVGQAALTADDVRALAARVVRRAEQSTGHSASSVQVFPNLNTFSLSGPPALIRTIAEQPEVIALRSTELDESPAIEPSPTRPSEAEKARRPSARRGRNPSK